MANKNNNKENNKNNKIIDLDSARKDNSISVQDFLSEEDKTEKNNIITENSTEKIARRFTSEQVEKIREKFKNKNKKDNNTIILKDCVDVVDEFVFGSISAEQLEDFGNKMSIRAYVPILEKMSILMRILMQHEISAVESTEIRMTELYKDIFFTVVMKTYGQIQFNEFDSKDKELLTYENYDKLFPLFNQFILSYCKEDYEIFMSMLKDCISFNGVMTLADGMSGLNSDKIDEAVKANKELIEGLKENKEMVENLKDIMMTTDETTKKVVENVKGMVLSEVMEKGKQSLEDKLVEDEKKKNDELK